MCLPLNGIYSMMIAHLARFRFHNTIYIVVPYARFSFSFVISSGERSTTCVFFAFWRRSFLRVMHNAPSYAVRTYPFYIIKCRIVFISTIYINMFNCIDVKTILIINVSIALITEPEHIIVFKFISRELIPTFFTGHLKEASTVSFWSVLICFTDEAKTTRH